MPLEWLKWLEDIRCAADAAIGFCASREFEQYQSDFMLRSAVERQLIVIGEAFSRLSDEAPEVARGFQELRQAISVRNRLVHGYSSTDDLIIWQVVTVHLPTTLARVAELLKREDS